MKKMFLKSLMGAAIAASLLASQGANVYAESDDNVTLTWAVFETDNYTAEVWQTIIDAFEADNPGIKIEKVLMTGDSRPQFLKTMLSAGNMPDINIDPVDLASTEGVYAEVPEELLAKFEDSAVVSFNGVKNLVPAYKAYRTQVFYNKHQFADAGITEVPQTWDEFINVCDTLQEAGYTPLMGVGASDIWATAFGYWTGVVNSELYTAYLGRVFRKETGSSFADYLNNYRIKKAENLLLSTNYKGIELAENVGFSSYNYFYIVFKKITGKKPMDIRKDRFGLK